MIEKSHANSTDTDITHIMSVDDQGELDQNQKPLTGSPPTATADDITIAAVDESHHTDFTTELEIGSVIKDTYELVALLGDGGMGTVFKALNKVWAEVEARDPYVAIKVLKPELSANKQLIRSLYSDFDRTKTLANCPNIIKVHGFDRDGSHVYMTMEYLTGQTLGEYLNRQPMSLTHAWFIIEGIGNALAYAHQNNIVHRDIKPGNIIITDKGAVKVLDFGIASKINENEGDETKFGGHTLGALTVAYASPEMQRDYLPDARDDIYAFACVIYEILTGKQFYKQKTHKAAAIAGLNSRQMDALNKALAFERDQRTTSVNELLDKLRPAAHASWVKYVTIGAGAGLILVALSWHYSHKEELAKTTAITELNVTKAADKIVAPVNDAASLTDIEKANKQAAAIKVQEEADRIAAELKAKEEADKKAAELQEKEDAAKAELAARSATSSDGLIHLQLSKSQYKQGESFKLSFILAKPSYVRIIDRDAKGELTVLRPNPRQPDKLQPANKEQSFPPKDIVAPVQGLSGDSTVTLVTSSQPFPKNSQLINADGSISEQVLKGPYSWVQIRYTLSR